MKKIMISLLLLAVTTSSFAQLKVLSNGHVTVNRDSEISGALLSVGSGSTTINTTSNNFGIYTCIPLTANKYNAAIIGTNYNSSILSSGSAIGVCGSAGYASSGRNYKQTEIVANNVYIGSNVTASTDNGPVVILGNKASLRCNGIVTIENDFEVKKGAEFSITIN